MPYKDDIHSAHARIDALEREKYKLEQQLLKKTKEKKVKCRECGGLFARLGGALFGSVLGLAVVALPVSLAYNSIVNSKDTHCYVESFNRDGARSVDLTRNVEWGSDYLVGRYSDIETALADAAKINCEVR